MNNMHTRFLSTLSILLLVLFCFIAFSSRVSAQQFDFRRLEEKVLSFTVVIDLKVEISFGIHTTEQSDRFLGTVVTEDGLIIFDGSPLAGDGGLAAMSGFTVKTTPLHVEVSTLNGETYPAEYLGVGRFSKIGFIKVTSDDARFTPVQFKNSPKYQVGDWLALYMLLPEFINPSLAADVGMISALIESPDSFPLTVGFNSLQLTSVLFNEDLEPVGVLGTMLDPGSSTTDAGGLLESFGQFGMPLLGVIDAKRLEPLIADPPQQGVIDRGWLGITLQALTKDIAEFWNLDVSGGIIVNEIVKGSPAERSGLQVGDIITQVNDQPVGIDQEEKIPVFQRLIAEMGPGADVEMFVMRRDDLTTDTLRLVASLGDAPLAAADAEEFENKELELKVRNLVFSDYMINNLDPEQFSGVVVSHLKMGGPAVVGGLRIGDIIRRIGDEDISSTDDAAVAFEQIEMDQPSEVIFFIWRQNKTLFVNVKIN